MNGNILRESSIAVKYHNAYIAAGWKKRFPYLEGSLHTKTTPPDMEGEMVRESGLFVHQLAFLEYGIGITPSSSI